MEDETPDTPSEPDPLEGIPAQGDLDLSAARQALGQVRHQIAASKVDYHISVRIGIEGVHPEQLRKALARNEKIADALEALLVAGEVPDPVAEVIEIPRLVVPDAHGA